MQANLKKVKQLNNKTAVALQEVATLKMKQEAEKKTLEQQKQEKELLFNLFLNLFIRYLHTQLAKIDKILKDSYKKISKSNSHLKNINST